MQFNDGSSYEKSMGVWSALIGNHFIDWLSPRSDGKWLDVGCGNGRDSYYFAEQEYNIDIVYIVPRFPNQSLNLTGSIENGSGLFRMNCVGCHGISAQGLVGPDLNEVTEVLSDKKIIIQVVKGLTPPMPSFEMDEQSMADLLAYLHSLNG